ncbi:hypothetical protein ER308_09680 [Egibacter rhizosphaerae]|uniref:Cell wall-binding repeat-containing protein n=1 Tax=Egibacter rhizosphaerae TaxID=1670831 RepID=A0A411YF02_9ACTN|nr:cell wall-binding repeat-containing protein [Egibacter rhizosphaerae]QBI19798.1 hypothetical protein ER308_09680 [Egibacter rhizosphaerae]
MARAVGRVAVVLAVLAVAFFIRAPDGTADQTDAHELTGDDPVSSAVEFARLAHPDGAVEEVVLGRADVFSDTLAAGSVTGQPVLLTPTDELAALTAEELDRLGAQRVTILGGPAAVAPEVEEDLRARGYEVERHWGEDRVGTALAVARERHADASDTTVVLARAHGEGTQAFVDALGGSALTHAMAGPVLLTPSDNLDEDVAAYLQEADAREVVIAGGSAAVSEAVEEELAALGVTAERAAGQGRSGTAVAQNVRRGVAHASDASSVLLLDGDDEGSWAAGFAAGPWAAETGAALVLTRGGRLPNETTTFLANANGPQLRCGSSVTANVCEHAGRALELPPFASAGGITLHQPSTLVELIGWHESNDRGAQQLQPASSASPHLTLDSRGRDAPSRSSADVVMDPDRPVRSPVSGEVVRTGTYQLYCRHNDGFAVIAPDSRPEWEVKVLHMRGLRVNEGDRVVQGETLLADGPRPFPFRSQVDDESSHHDWPHVHIEVLDPSVWNPPSSGC